MKNSILVLVIVWAITSCASKQNDSPSEFVIGKGTNLAHWLSQSKQRGEARRLVVQERDIEYIANLGFEHVRLPSMKNKCGMNRVIAIKMPLN